ncbi:MAG: serine/threonine protein kinase [bacterium]|nr:serine/threonine protein kinase [bacterium]
MTRDDDPPPARPNPLADALRRYRDGEAIGDIDDDLGEGGGLAAALANAGVQRSGSIADVGDRIEGFTLLEEIGDGGEAKVYSARQHKPVRDVALKVFKLFSTSTDRALQGANAQARFEHENVVRVWHCGETADVSYIAMALVPGKTHLGDWIGGAPGPVTDRNYVALASFFAQVADGLAAAHDHGVIHRDIKPSNILIDGEKPLLSDFGMARFDTEKRITKTGEMQGTWPYLPPEVIQGTAGLDLDEDKLGDVYSLGVTLYEALTGALPFDEPNTVALSRAIAERDPPPPTDTRLPSDLVAICMRALEKQPRRRYASMAEFAADLRRFAAGEPTHARPISRLQRVWRRVMRHPAWIAIGVVLVTALMFGVHFWLESNRVTEGFNKISAIFVQGAVDDVFRVEGIKDPSLRKETHGTMLGYVDGVLTGTPRHQLTMVRAVAAVAFARGDDHAAATDLARRLARLHGELESSPAERLEDDLRAARYFRRRGDVADSLDLLTEAVGELEREFRLGDPLEAALEVEIALCKCLGANDDYPAVRNELITWVGILRTSKMPAGRVGRRIQWLLANADTELGSAGQAAQRLGALLEEEVLAPSDELDAIAMRSDLGLALLLDGRRVDAREQLELARLERVEKLGEDCPMGRLDLFRTLVAKSRTDDFFGPWDLEPSLADVEEQSLGRAPDYFHALRELRRIYESLAAEDQGSWSAKVTQTLAQEAVGRIRAQGARHPRTMDAAWRLTNHVTRSLRGR